MKNELEKCLAYEPKERKTEILKERISIIQVNQSFLVNLRYVSSYHNHKITLGNDCEITISRSCRNMFREAYLNYQRSHYHVTVL